MKIPFFRSPEYLSTVSGDLVKEIARERARAHEEREARLTRVAEIREAWATAPKVVLSDGWLSINTASDETLCVRAYSIMAFTAEPSGRWDLAELKLVTTRTTHSAFVELGLVHLYLGTIRNLLKGL